jgi:hypothetical protein
MLADRRLSANAVPVRDDARKLMFLETTDGVAILGYAGLGATAAGTELADWMSAVLRGRNMPLEQSLGVLAEAMKKQLPMHMLQVPAAGPWPHWVVAAALFGDEPRIYTIVIELSPDRKAYRCRYERRVVDPARVPVRTPRFAVSGSGALVLLKDKKWMRDLLRVVRASDRKQVPPDAVADHLAALNFKVHQAEQTVGPRCIVAWRNKKTGIHRGGGGHRYYTKTERERDTPAMPNIAGGSDWTAVINLLKPYMQEMMEATIASKEAPQLDKDKINAQAAKLPNTPDEKLR